MQICDDFFKMTEPTNKNQKSDLSEIERSMALLVKENEALRTALKDVADVNKSWQVFNESRRNCTESRLAVIPEQQTPKPVNQGAELLRELYAIPEDYDVIQKKYHELLQSYSEVVDEKRKIQLELDNYRKDNDTSWKERALILQAQVNSYREDFNAEREEKRGLLRAKKLQDEEIRRLQTDLAVGHHRHYSRQPVHNICKFCHTISVNAERVIERRNSSPRLISRGVDIFFDQDLVVDRPPTENSTPEKTQFSSPGVASGHEIRH